MLRELWRPFGISPLDNWNGCPRRANNFKVQVAIAATPDRAYETCPHALLGDFPRLAEVFPNVIHSFAQDAPNDEQNLQRKLRSPRAREGSHAYCGWALSRLMLRWPRAAGPIYNRSQKLCAHLKV